MGRSEDLMPTIDRVSIFDRNAEFEGMDFATRAIEVGNYTDRSAVPIYASVTSGTTYQRHGDPSRDALCSNIASLENAKSTRSSPRAAWHPSPCPCWLCSSTATG